jgi:hypothetical protein
MQKDGRIDRQTDMTKLIVASRNFAKAPKMNFGPSAKAGALNLNTEIINQLLGAFVMYISSFG